MKFYKQHIGIRAYWANTVELDEQMNPVCIKNENRRRNARRKLELKDSRLSPLWRRWLSIKVPLDYSEDAVVQGVLAFSKTING